VGTWGHFLRAYITYMHVDSIRFFPGKDGIERTNERPEGRKERTNEQQQTNERTTTTVTSTRCLRCAALRCAALACGPVALWPVVSRVVVGSPKTGDNNALLAKLRSCEVAKLRSCEVANLEAPNVQRGSTEVHRKPVLMFTCLVLFS